MKKALYILAGIIVALLLAAGGVVWYLHGWRFLGSDLVLHESWSAQERSALQQVEAEMLRGLEPVPVPECVEELGEYWQRCVEAKKTNLDELRMFRRAAETGRGDVYSALGFQPMWYAVVYDQFELARAFAERGADPVHPFYLEEGDMYADVMATLVGRVRYAPPAHPVEKALELLNYVVEERGVDVRKSPRHALLRFALVSCVSDGGDAGAMMAWAAARVQPFTAEELREFVGTMVSLDGTLPGLRQMQLAGVLPAHVFGGEESILRCIRFWDKDCVQKAEWILNQNQAIPSWEPFLAYIEADEEWQRAMACCRLALQAGVCMEFPERNLPVNPVFRDEICALLQEFGQRPGAR